MNLKFSEQPGPRERHLKRKATSPLFPHESLDQSQVDQARQADENEQFEFMNRFQQLVQEAVNLKPETDSEVILNLKERLDQSYAHCCSLPGDHQQIKQAIIKLIDAIMGAVRAGAQDDPVALKKLDEEEIARRDHYAMHEYKIVADFMLEDCPIAEDEFIPTLLGEDGESFAAALNLFEPEHLASIYQHAKDFLQALTDQGIDTSDAMQRLQEMELFLTQSTSNDSQIN